MRGQPASGAGLAAVWIAALVLAPARTGTAGELLAPETAIHAVVDHYLAARLESADLAAAPEADEASFVRRLTLDLAGRIPAMAEVQAWVDSTEPDKRQQLVARLVDSTEFVEHQADVFDTFLAAGQGSLRGYLKTAFDENRGWDRMFREILLARHDDPAQKEALDFLRRRVRDLDRLTNDASIAFFGINISCAQCHDHPLVADWSQDHFYGMKSFFSRTFENGGFIGEREYGRVSYQTADGESRQAKLMFLTGTVIDEPEGKQPSGEEQKQERERLKQLADEKQPPPEPSYSRRQQLVEIALRPGEDDYFARAIVNRVWHQLFGYGLVMPLDQMHSENPASHPELLAWLARDLKTHGYDLRRLVRGLVLSQAYSRSSRWDASERPLGRFFAVAQVRPLTPRQLARSLSLATADPESLAGELPLEQLAERIAQAAGAANANLFDQPGENFQVSADEALLFSNSEQIAQSYLDGGLVRRLEQIPDDDEMLRTAIWSVLTRAADDEELAILREYVGQRSDRREAAIRQVVWSLLASSEFRFNH